MEISRKSLTSMLLLWGLLCCLLTFTFTYGWQNGFFIHKDTQPEANVYIFKETPEGEALIASGNLITDIGEQYFRNILGFDNVTSHNATKWISLGNSTIVASKTKLDAEATTLGFARALGAVTAWVNSGDYAYNVTKKFTATGTIRINATGSHWNPTADSDTNMVACASLGGYEDFQNNWNCTIVWVFTWDAN